MLSKVPHLPNHFMFPRSHEKTPQHISPKMTLPWSMTSPAPQRKAEARPIRTSLKGLQGKWRMEKTEDSQRKVSSPWRNSTQNNIRTGLNVGGLIHSLWTFQMWEISCPSHLSKYQPRQIIIFLWTEMCHLLEKPVVEVESNILHRFEGRSSY